MAAGFDLVTMDSPATDALMGLGARRLGAVRHETYGSIVNLADPDGNPFDRCAYS